jgi:hypothetical protein
MGFGLVHCSLYLRKFGSRQRTRDCRIIKILHSRVNYVVPHQKIVL